MDILKPPYHVDRRGFLAIAGREALVLVAYQDGEHMSIGFGHNDPKLKPGDRIAVKRAFELLLEDVRIREKPFSQIITRDVTQNQFNGMMSLHYQSGNRFITKNEKYPGPFVIDLFNEHGIEAAAEKWEDCNTNKAGVKLEGLIKRRRFEKNVMLHDAYGDQSTIPYWDGNPKTTKRREYVIQPDDLPI